MDLLSFDGEPMYFDRPMDPEVAALLKDAAAHYGEPSAEHRLLRAYFLAPEHLTVLVALYRYFFYRHRYAEALIVADRAISRAAAELDVGVDWRAMSKDDLGRAVLVSMSLTRFLLLALKGAGYIRLRLGDVSGALARFEKVAELDASDRLGMAGLVALARAQAAEQAGTAVVSET